MKDYDFTTATENINQMMSEGRVSIYRCLKAHLPHHSICRSKINSRGNVTREKGVSHFNDGITLTDVMINNPESIRKGCVRIKENYREVVAYTSGYASYDAPEGTLIGYLDLCLESEAFVLRHLDLETVELFDPTGVALRFTERERWCDDAQAMIMVGSCEGYA